MKKFFDRVKLAVNSFLQREGKAKKDFYIKIVAIGIVISVAVFFLMFTGKGSRKLVPSANTGKKEETKEIGLFVGDVDTKTYFTRLEKEYYEVMDKMNILLKKLETVEATTHNLRKNQSDLSEAVLKLDEQYAKKIDQKFQSLRTEMENGRNKGDHPLDFLKQDGPSNNDTYVGTNKKLEIVSISKIEESTKDNESVYLPLGSFCKGTLLTGVFAPADQGNPLPVLISLDEAFYGPNNSRIPLKGAVAIGKAIGDLTSKRAVIQIVAISTVHRSGETFEFEGNLGYLADDKGQLGIAGEVVYNTGKQLGLSFLSGFLAGMGEAFAEKETTSVTGDEGAISKNVTGSASKYAMFSGLSQSAAQMSEYYQKQIEKMIPAVRVDSGKKVVFIVQQGVKIEGLQVTRNRDFRYID